MIEVSAEFCPQNHPCPVVRMCPTGAIKQEGFGLPTIDEALCTGCGRCTRGCMSFSFSEPRARHRAAK